MRFPRLMILSMIGAVALVPRAAPAQISATVQIGPQYEVRVNPYSREVYGDWRTSYRRWQPVTLYARDGRFYSRSVAGSRPVVVYRSQNEYFLPPRDQAWNNFDRRYDYNRRPGDDDYSIVDRLLNIFGGRPSRTWGSEVFLNVYSPDVFGDWRTGYRRWQPVTLYVRAGRYYTRQIPNSRAVTVYRWRNQYFLPPRDQDWRNRDRRYDYNRSPTDEDYNWVQRNPGQYSDQTQPGGYNNSSDLAVTVYSPQVQGDWRTDYMRWDPVTVYARDGRYYPTAVPGGRAVVLYRWQGQYFLPPRDQGWNNIDRRYNYTMRPTDEDYYNAQRVARRPQQHQ